MSRVENFLTLFANCTFRKQAHFEFSPLHFVRQNETHTHTIYLIVTHSEKGFKRTNRIQPKKQQQQLGYEERRKERQREREKRG